MFANSKRAVLGISLLFVSACGMLRTENRSPSRSMSTQVYAALLDSLYKQPDSDTILIADSTIRFHVPTNSVEPWRRQFDSIPSDLPPRLEHVSRDRQSSTALPLPRPIRLLPYTELREIFKNGAGRGWQEFTRRYPRQRQYLQLSPIVFDADSLNALVYYEYHCGPLCGGGDAVWLTRGLSHKWNVRKVIGFWVS